MIGLAAGLLLVAGFVGLRQSVVCPGPVESATLFAFFGFSLIYYVSPRHQVFALVALLVIVLSQRIASGPAAAMVVGTRCNALAGAGIIAIVLICWVVMRDVATQEFQGYKVATGAAAVILVAVCIESALTNALTAQVVARYASGFIGLALIIGRLRGNEWLDCRVLGTKCTAAGRIYVGIFGDGFNALTLYAGVAFLLSLRLPSSRWKKAVLFALATVMAITYGRTTLVAIALVPVLGLVVSSTALYRDSEWMVRRGTGTSVFLITSMTGLYLAFHAKAGDFTQRGKIWQEIAGYVRPTSPFGEGQSTYSALIRSGHFRGHYPHSEYLMLLFFGGVIAVVLFGLFLVIALGAARASSRRALVLHVAPVLFLFIHGLTEVSWNPGAVDPNFLMLIAVIAAATPDAVVTAIKPAMAPVS